LAITGPARVSLLRDVPTFAEAGLPTFDHKSWFAVFAPAGTPGPVVERLGTEIRQMVASPRVREVFGREGVEAFVSTPEEVTSMMRADSVELSRVIEAAHIRMD
jgi:tripartite-type tricarboxylate transporter receptor subunit TctC